MWAASRAGHGGRFEGWRDLVTPQRALVSLDAAAGEGVSDWQGEHRDRCDERDELGVDAGHVALLRAVWIDAGEHRAGRSMAAHRVLNAALGSVRDA
jgi:hypothetical protein